MQAFWTGTPYFNWYVYMGGANRACSQPNLTANWVNQVQGGSSGTQAWGLVGIWVGPQPPRSAAGHTCNTRTYGSYISLNTVTAYTQGQNEAVAAYSAGVSLFGTTDFPVAYDLEAFVHTDPVCLAAVKSFMSGWTEYLDNPPAQTSGTYGSTCGSALNSFASIARPPDFIWGAQYSSPPVPSTRSMSCVNSGYWVYNQRHKQYRGQHNETYNGITLSVDNDCANGPVFFLFDRFDAGSICL